VASRPTYEELRKRVQELEEAQFERKRAEDALRESEALFRNLFKHHAAVMLIIDPDTGNIIDANITAAEFYGWTRAQLRQMRIQDINTLSPEEVKQEMEKARARERIHFEFRHRRADGSIRDVDVFSSKIEAKGKDLLYSIIHDITDRKQAEEALRKSEERFRAFETASSEVVYRMSPDWTELRHLEGKEFIPDTESPNRTWLDKYIHPDDQPHVLNVINEAIRSKSVFELEHRVLRVDGSLGWTYSRAVPLLDANDDVVEWFGTASDITARKSAQEALRQSEERFRVVVSSTPDHVLVQDRNLRYTMVINPQLGLTEHDMIGKTDFDILVKEDAEKLTAIKRQVLETGKPVYVEPPLISQDDEPEFFEGSYVPKFDAEGRCDGLIGYFRNVTKRKQVEEALRESEGRLRAIFQSAEEAIITLDKEQRFLRANPAAGVITGVPCDQLIGRFLSDFVDPSFDLSSAWEGFLKSGRFKGEVPIRHSSGSLRVVEASGTRDIGLGRHLFIGRDVTEHKSAELAVKEAREYAESIIATVREPLVVLDADLRVVSTNRSFLQTFQVNKRETYGRLIYELGNRQWSIPRLRDLLEGILPRNAVFENFEMSHDFPNLGRRTMLLNARRLYRETKATELILLAIEDITERKQVEEALRRSRDELELRVGERTADLELRNKELQNFVFVASHDLREPLRKIQTFGDMLTAKRDVPLDESSRNYITRMQRAAARMQDLLNSLLSYSRVITKGEPEDETDLGKSVKAALSNLEMIIREKNGRVEVGDLPRVRADHVSIIQLFQNLIENALKFHRDGEALHIKIHAKEVRDAHEIYIEDNGIGFEEKYLDKIFLPFQRLHGRSSEYGGVGMGLAICKKIVERHGGSITARSKSGQGSTFIVDIAGEAESNGMNHQRPGCGSK
jgi:PAS domain S-box-containing protein